MRSVRRSGEPVSGPAGQRSELTIAAADIAKYRRLAEESSKLARRFDGSFAGEHGVGIARGTR